VGEKPGENRFLGDAAVANNPNLPDDFLLRPGGEARRAEKEHQDGSAHPKQERPHGFVL
jgi:hypothetical protein